MKQHFLLLFLVSSLTMLATPTVEIQLPGLLGNRLFTFCVGKIIADKLGYNLYSMPIYGFPYTYSFSKNYPSGAYPTEKFHCTHDIDIEKITANHTPRNIELQGYFQRYKYLQLYAEKIRQEWLVPDPRMTYTQDPDDIVVHVRANHPSCFVPFEYYEKALASTTYNRVFICTDEPKDPFLNNFKKYNPIVHSTRSLSQVMNAGMSWPDVSALNVDEFFFLCSFNKIIMSQSTFAWWAGYLSNAEEVYAPYSFDERFQVYGKVDEARYHYIDTVIGH